jgi:DNA modification methylase
MVCRKGNAVLMNPAPQCHILAQHDEYKDSLGHPFVKPYDVWHFILQYISIEGQTILEPFAGRGSGVISIQRDNRNVIACESNLQHYNALVNNVQNHYLSINPNFTFA